MRQPRTKISNPKYCMKIYILASKFQTSTILCNMRATYLILSEDNFSVVHPHLQDDGDQLNQSVVIFSGLIEEMNIYNIKLRSPQIHPLAGSPIKISIARMMAQSTSVLLFLSSDYLKSELSHFELDLLNVRSHDDVVVVTLNEDLVPYMDRIPQCVADILLDNRHLVFPVGICSGGEANYNAFLQTLAVKICGKPVSNSENL